MKYQLRLITQLSRLTIVHFLGFKARQAKVLV